MKISSKVKRGGASALLARSAAAMLLAAFTFKENLLRASPEALASLMKARAVEISAMKADLARGTPRPEFARLRAEIDAAAHQKDAAWSGLYWYTSLPEALAAAKRESKPVLSLRLLGRLDEELSCANSRYFRTALYANERVSRELRENWILHWESVRPAPKVTIDFGDGRTLTRTVTGNSLHYVLDAEGRASDVLPGLWAPEEFLRRVREAREGPKRAGAGDAKAAASLDAPRRPPDASRPLEESPSSSSPSPAPPSSLDSNSRALMRAKAPLGLSAAAFGRLVASFERTLAEDTRRNAALRERILPWLADAKSAAALPALTDRIYRDAFLTPRSDPWLGLVVADVYSAIEGEPLPAEGSVDALRAGGVTASKMVLERPLLAKVVLIPR